ncbi:VapE domain-containing protein [Silvanigrella sp.]|jgi:hypothetical protein|uniref:VapE domain-containing protein n=1 Tax=Silvanigrella sp. TaxID=2024976 RepID=UPI0037CB294F
MSDKVVDLLKESHKQNIKKRSQFALRDNDIFLEIIAMLEKEYLCDGERYYKITDYRNRVCKLIKYTNLKNACINIRKTQKVDSKTANEAIIAWKSEVNFISEPSLLREESDDDSWQLEAKSEINNIIIENDPRRWLDVWFASKNIQIHSSNELSIDGEKFPIDEAIAVMNCDFITNKPDKTRITLQVLRNALDLKMAAELKKIRNKIISTLNFEADLNRNMERFVTALLGKYDHITDMVLRHFIWQVKRKIFGKKVYDHLMPIIYGSQGIGKSEAIKKFISPLDGLWIEGKFTDLTDDRNSKFFESNYIMFFDEMKGATKADIEEIKERITAEFIKFRLLFTHNMLRISNNCTFIGTSNKPVSLLIRDETGMRRFYEVEVLKECNWDEINKIDYLAIWKDVDESVDRPFISACKKEIKEQQELNRDKNSVEQWVEERSLSQGTTHCKLNDAYDDYCHFCSRSGLHSDSKRNFGIKLKAKLKVTSFILNGQRYYALNKEFTSQLLPRI